MPDAQHDLVSLTVDIVSAHVSNNKIAGSEVATLIQTVYDALSTAGAPPAPQAAKPEPAVSVRASVKPDYIVCLEDGKKLKMLKRYLRTNYNMTPEEYRAKWDLPRDYPMVAPAYAEQRRGLAKEIGLGRKPQAVAAVKTAARTAVKKATKGISEGLDAARAHLGTAETKAPAKRGRKPKASPADVAPATGAPAGGRTTEA